MQQKDNKQKDLVIFQWAVSFIAVAFVIVAIFFTRPAPAVRLPGEPNRVRTLGDFRLTDRTGRVVSRAELQNSYLVVNFVFTSCSISCLQVNQRMAEVQRLVSCRVDVRLVSFTVDPGTDTPQTLAQFGEKFGADTNRWLLLTGDKRMLYELIEDSFLKRDPTITTGGMPGGFVGTDRIVLVDGSGKIRKYFDGFNPATPEAVLASLNNLKQENKKP